MSDIRKNDLQEIAEQKDRNHGRQMIQEERIDGKYVLIEFLSVLNFRKGILYSIKELLIRPGVNVRDFINGYRVKLIKPVPFIIFCSIFYIVFHNKSLNKDFFDHFINGFVDTLGVEHSVLSDIFGWIHKNYAYTNILMSVFIVLGLKLLFRKSNYNFFELLVLLIYVQGISILIYSSFFLCDILLDIRVSYLGGVLGFIYSSWAVTQFYNEPKFRNYLKSITALFFGMFAFYFTIIMIGTLIDLVKMI